MPNWCYTNYKIQGDQESLEALDKVISTMKAIPEPYIPNGFGNLWLGCLVAILGGSCDKIYCRGQILEYEKKDGMITMEIESAWSEPSEVRKFIKKKLPGLKIYYQAEESGMCIFETNDKDGTYFPEKWILDWCDEKKNLYLYEYFEDLPAVVAYLEEYGVITKDVEATKEAITAALEELQEQRPDDISFMFEEFKVLDD